jgi:hypothetical protein
LIDLQAEVKGLKERVTTLRRERAEDTLSEGSSTEKSKSKRSVAAMSSVDAPSEPESATKHLRGDIAYRLPKRDPDEVIHPGDVVYVHEGRVNKRFGEGGQDIGRSRSV